MSPAMRTVRAAFAAFRMATLGCSPTSSTKTYVDAPQASGQPDLAIAAPQLDAGDSTLNVEHEPALCANDVYRADPVPVVVFLLVDSSASMALPLRGDPNRTSKWVALREAVTAFITDPKSAGLGVG